MNREIKFRAWDGSYDKMIYKGITDNHHICVSLTGIIFGISHNDETFEVRGDTSGMFPKRFTLMQFTGLKDKNGVEIYEGDVVKYKFLTASTNNEFTSAVAWDEYMWITDEHSINRIHNIEVIGNIYENPDLLPTLPK